jgi:AcrR family transcriptional regulator
MHASAYVKPRGDQPAMTDDPAAGRVAQRRRTRKAIVDATAQLLSAGADPSVADIATAADVSRRTIYTYFPTLDQLLLDATLGALSSNVDAEIAATDAPGAAGADGPGPALARAERILDVISRSTADTLPLGRKLIKLTVDVPPTGTGPKRGYRRVQWIEATLTPWRDTLDPDRFEDLVSALVTLSGWEGFIVLTDLRELDPDRARAVSVQACLALIRAAIS